MPPIGSVRTFRRKGSVPMTEPTLSQEQAGEYILAASGVVLQLLIDVRYLREKVKGLEQDLEQLYHEMKGNGP